MNLSRLLLRELWTASLEAWALGLLSLCDSGTPLLPLGLHPPSSDRELGEILGGHWDVASPPPVLASPPPVSQRYCGSSSWERPRSHCAPSPVQQRHLLPPQWHFPHFLWICLNPTPHPNISPIPSSKILPELTKSIAVFLQ